MTSKSHNTPLARLSRIGLALGIGSTQATRSSKREDDSYIPYNGPYESPTKGQQIRGYWENGAQNAALDARSFSPPSFNEGKTHTSYNQVPSFSNGRKHSDTPRVTLSNIMTEPRRRFTRTRQNSTPPLGTSYVSLDKSGGIGDTPVPVHRSTLSQPRSLKRRNSLFRASVTDLRKGLSRSDDKRERTRPFGVPTDDLVLSALSSPSVYGQASHRSRLNSAAARQRQQYAAASPHLGQPSSIQTDSQNKKRELYDKSSKKVPAHLRPSSRASLLKASVSTPDLHSASRQSAMYVKTKARWLAAETWCDAFMFPRPRFLLRHLEEGSATPNHRFVSSAESIVSEAVGPSAEPKSLKKSQSVAELRTSGFPKEIPTRVDRNDAPRSPSAARPKSFALDDLALPSPVPSLITVLTDRQNLQNERQMWQECATKSLGNRRTRTLSRSKSLGKTQKPSYQQLHVGTFDFLVERTLLGHQAMPSVVHTTTNSSTIPTQTASGEGQTTRSFGSTFSRLRSKSHGHSNSVGTTHDSSGHRRKESVSSVLRRAKSTATGLCIRADRTSTPPDAMDLFAGKDDTKVITLSERPRRMTSPNIAVSISPTMDRNRSSPDRGLLVPSHQRFDISPSPSSQSRSAEGVGIAISSLPPSEEHSDDELITLPTHPYAQGSNSHRRTPVNTTPQLLETHHRQPIIHPYAIHSAHPAALSPQWTHRDRTVSPTRRMYAEITPGHLREIRPEEIQYSPYLEDAPRVLTTVRAINRPVTAERQSGDPPSRRGSDTLRMGEALNLSLARSRLSSSTDSGIGASEDLHPYGPQPERAPSSRSSAFPLRPVQELLSPADGDGDEGTPRDGWLELPPTLPRTDGDNFDPASLRTASSGQINPSVPSDLPTPVRRMGSSGSSPGLSNDSSPPLTPRPLGRLDDLERFQDLFYNLAAHQPRLPELSPLAVSVTEPDDRRLATGPINLARSRSQLTTLVRQLSEDMYELRNEEPIPEDDGRLEGLNDERSRDPVAHLGTPPSSDSSPSVLGTTHPFLSTISPQYSSDQPLTSSRQNFPEDVESELSSLSDRIPEEHYDETMETLRLGNVEVVSTPPPINTPRRLSGHVTLINDAVVPTTGGASSSSLILPHTGITRSSYLTIDSGDSRISGLSAFPRPPSEQSADILASYFAEEVNDDDIPELISTVLQSPLTTTGEQVHAP